MLAAGTPSLRVGRVGDHTLLEGGEDRTERLGQIGHEGEVGDLADRLVPLGFVVVHDADLAVPVALDEEVTRHGDVAVLQIDDGRTLLPVDDDVVGVERGITAQVLASALVGAVDLLGAGTFGALFGRVEYPLEHLHRDDHRRERFLRQTPREVELAVDESGDRDAETSLGGAFDHTLAATDRGDGEDLPVLDRDLDVGGRIEPIGSLLSRNVHHDGALPLLVDAGVDRLLERELVGTLLEYRDLDRDLIAPLGVELAGDLAKSGEDGRDHAGRKVTHEELTLPAVSTHVDRDAVRLATILDRDRKLHAPRHVRTVVRLPPEPEPKPEIRDEVESRARRHLTVFGGDVERTGHIFGLAGLALARHLELARADDLDDAADERDREVSAARLGRPGLDVGHEDLIDLDPELLDDVAIRRGIGERADDQDDVLRDRCHALRERGRELPDSDRREQIELPECRRNPQATDGDRGTHLADLGEALDDVSVAIVLLHDIPPIVPSFTRPLCGCF